MIRAVAGLLVLATAAAGCASYTLGPAPAVGGARTVEVPIFENRTYRRGVEVDLARALVEEIKARTALRIVARGGDLVLDGALAETEEIPLSERRNENIRESSVHLTVEITVRDGRTGEPVVPRRLLHEREAFVPMLGESVRSSRAEALRRLASDIVDLLEAR